MKRQLLVIVASTLVVVGLILALSWPGKAQQERVPPLRILTPEEAAPRSGGARIIHVPQADDKVATPHRAKKRSSKPHVKRETGDILPGGGSDGQPNNERARQR